MMAFNSLESLLPGERQTRPVGVATHAQPQAGAAARRTRARSQRGLAEEHPDAYKDVNLVVDVVHSAGLSRKVARMRPIGVIKG